MLNVNSIVISPCTRQGQVQAQSLTRRGRDIVCVWFIHPHLAYCLVGPLALDVGAGRGGRGRRARRDMLAGHGEGAVGRKGAATPYPPLYLPLVLGTDGCLPHQFCGEDDGTENARERKENRTEGISKRSYLIYQSQS